MKRPDCGNQRTGQPRCAQLIAKTWNWPRRRRRTQQGMSAVAPSQGRVSGCGRWPSASGPRGRRRRAERHPRERGSPCASRAPARAGSRRSAPPSSAPATALSAIAELQQKAAPRRRAGLSHACSSRMARSVAPDGALARSRRAPRGKPRDDVGHLLAVSGAPGASPRQSGCPMSGRPAMTVVRRLWSLTRPRNEPSTIEPAFGPPSPFEPWQDAQNAAKTARRAPPRRASRRRAEARRPRGLGLRPAADARDEDLDLLVGQRRRRRCARKPASASRPRPSAMTPARARHRPRSRGRPGSRGRSRPLPLPSAPWHPAQFSA